MSPPPVDPKVMQDQVDKQHEPASRKMIIDKLNEHSAKNRTGLALRLPQPSPVGHCIFTADCQWTEEEAECLAQDGKLPRDLTNLDEQGKCVLLWAFDATAAGGELPELELDIVPDLKKHPALCAFDMDGKGAVALIPSEFLDLIPTGKNKVQFVLKDQRLEDCTMDRFLKG